MAEKDIHILSTKIIAQTFIDSARLNGIIIDTHNFIHTSPIVSEDIRLQIKRIANNELYAVFTSAHAVYAVADYVNGGTNSWKVYCIDGNTKNAVQTFLPEAEIKATASNAAALAKAITNTHKEGDIYFFCGNKRLTDLPDILTAEKLTFTEIIVYQTTLTPLKIEKKYDGIIFYSPSGVDSFFIDNSTDDDMIFFTIGNTTANALKDFLNEIVVSNEPEINVLFETIINYYKRHNLNRNNERK